MSLIEKVYEERNNLEKVSRLQFLFYDDSDRITYISKHLDADKEHAIEYLKEMYYQIPTRVIFLRLAAISYFPVEKLKMLVNYFLDKNLTVEDLIKKAVLEKIDPFEIMVSRVLKALEIDPDEISWEMLYQELQESQNSFEVGCLDIFRKYFCDYRDQNPVPSWVTYKEGDSYQTIDTFTEEKVLTQEDFNKVLHTVLENSKIEEEELVKTLKICGELGKIQCTDEKKDRVFGMVNPSEEKCCSFNGNCRMLECNCYPGNDENYERSWFTEYCGQCGKSISEFFHAVRIPLENGGWYGCFCSMTCLRKKENDVRIDTLDVFLSTVGIADRNDSRFYFYEEDTNE